MAISIMIAAAEAGSGKTAIALGLLDQASRVVESIGVFRPLTRSLDPQANSSVELLLFRSARPDRLEDCLGVTYADLHEDPERAMSTIVDRFYVVADRHPAVLVLGSDYTDVGSPSEFAINARIAANLGAPMILVVSGADRSPAHVRGAVAHAVDEAHANHAHVLAVIANRTDPDQLDATVRAIEGAAGPHPTYAVPAEPLLSAPSVRDLMRAGDGVLLHGDEDLLDREAMGVSIAAMTLPNILDRVTEGSVVVTPADRADILLGLLLAHHSWNFPTLSAIVLNGGLEVDPRVTKVVDGLKLSMPIVGVPLTTSETARAFDRVVAQIGPTSVRKIQTALALCEKHIDAAAVLREIEWARRPWSPR